MTLLDQYLTDLAPQARQADERFWQQYGLPHNPFPPNRTIVAEILYDQQQAMKRFAGVVRELLENAPRRRALAVIAGTGGGKTHFLRHCQHAFRQTVGDQLHRTFAIAEVQAGSVRVQEIVREILRATKDVCLSQHETSLGRALIRGLEAQGADHLADVITYDEFRQAIARLRAAAAQDFIPSDQAGRYGFETLVGLFELWLEGGLLTQTDRKYLGVSTRISTASLAVRALRDVLALARSLGLVEGVFLCLDEVETVFSSGHGAARYQSFLQDIRYLYDEAVRNESGYSLLILSASTTTGANNLQAASLPAYQRLGFELDTRVDLLPIQGALEARDFAYTYVDYYRRLGEEAGLKARYEARDLLSERDVQDAYQRLAARQPLSARTAEGGVPVSQASLLEALHRMAEGRRQADEAANAS